MTKCQCGVDVQHISIRLKLYDNYMNKTDTDVTDELGLFMNFMK